MVVERLDTNQLLLVVEVLSGTTLCDGLKTLQTWGRFNIDLPGDFF